MNLRDRGKGQSIQRRENQYTKINKNKDALRRKREKCLKLQKKTKGERDERKCGFERKRDEEGIGKEKKGNMK